MLARAFRTRNRWVGRFFLVPAILVAVVIGLAASANSRSQNFEVLSPGAVGGEIQPRGTKSSLRTIAGVALVAPSSPSGSVPPEEVSRGAQIGLLTYIVKEGDTLSTIAVEFGVSLNTVLWENNLTARSVLKPGMKLSILPIDGVKHTVKRGDTVSGIAAHYESDIETILTYNILEEDEILTIGDVIIVPNGVPQSVVVSSPQNPSQGSTNIPPTRLLVDVSGYFQTPTIGKLTQGLHRYNAVDLGGSAYCGSPVRAAAAGTVTTARSGWNGGYGNYIKISHDNGTVTLYAHNAQNLVTVGQSVSQGQTVALLGSTGNSTGCHVHFEVRGARNPFAG